MTDQRVTMITLAVDDMATSRAFYEKLGWTAEDSSNEQITFFRLDGQFFALYAREALTKDIGLPIAPRTTGGATLATNYPDRAQVDTAYDRALRAGAVPISAPEDTPWGGYSAMITDPEGHLWEYAMNPFWTLDENGRIAPGTPG